MPYKTLYLAPSIAYSIELSDRIVYIYHCYENGNVEAPLRSTYTTDILEDEKYTFQMSELPIPNGVDKDDHLEIIRYAAKLNLLKFRTDSIKNIETWV